MGGKGRRSKKRSAASLKSKQLEPLVFFLDRSLGKEIIANSLRAAGADVRIHDDLFAQDARDQDWLPEVGKNGWTDLTKDSHIKHRLVERTALLESGVRAPSFLSRGTLRALRWRRYSSRLCQGLRDSRQSTPLLSSRKAT